MANKGCQEIKKKEPTREDKRERALSAPSETWNVGKSALSKLIYRALLALTAL